MLNDRIRGRARTLKLFKKVIRKSLEKPEKLTVSQWAEKYRELDETSSMPGRWSNYVTPYLVEIMDALNDPYIQHINFCKPTQVGGTEALINMMGWIIMQDPSPAMIIYPTDDLAKDISNDKLKPAFRKSKKLKERFYELNSKELNLKFKGMTLYLRGANSPSKLASKAIKFLMFDEIDKMGGASKKEASPYNLGLERTKTFKYSRKIYTCSTPSIKSNYVWSIHEAADEQRHFYVPCPHCKDLIELKFNQIKFVSDDEKQMTVSKRAETAIYVCQECGCTIENKEKPEMLKAGVWKTEKRACNGKPRSVSFWLNSLYSIFISWEDAAKEFLESKDDPEKLQNFVNSWLAEPWEDTKLKTSKELVLERQTEYEEFIVPDWAKMLTGGIDVQENCLYWTIRAFGDYLTSQNIAHGQALSFEEVSRIMNLEYQKRDGSKMLVDRALIDSGDQTDDVYEFCYYNSDWVLPCKGASNGMQSHYKISSVNKATSKAYGINLVLVDGGKYKDMIAGRLRKENGIGSFMVHKGCDDEYADQITSEHKIKISTNGRVSTQWVLKRSHADNHYLDCEVYAMCAADILDVRSLYLENKEPQKQEQAKQQVLDEENWIQQNESWV